PEPPQHLFDRNEITYDSNLDDAVDCHAVSRAWYGYAQEPVPDPDELPGSTKDIENPARQRRPKSLAVLLFRQYPARVQSFLGERLQQEGWFDDEGWEPVRWFRDAGPAGERRLGKGVKWSKNTWQRAYEMWADVGTKNHVVFSEDAPAR